MAFVRPPFLASIPTCQYQYSTVRRADFRLTVFRRGVPELLVTFAGLAAALVLLF
jgi:hypothetical protein